MNKIFSLIFILLSSIILFGQNKFKPEPFIIKGQLTDCPEKYLSIFFQNKNGQILIDTLNLDSSGKFYLKTFSLLPIFSLAQYTMGIMIITKSRWHRRKRIHNMKR